MAAVERVADVAPQPDINRPASTVSEADQSSVSTCATFGYPAPACVGEYYFWRERVPFGTLSAEA